MPKVMTEIGYKTPEGIVFKVTEAEATVGYMSAAEYCEMRAKQIGGKVVTRSIVVSDWKEVPDADLS